VARVRGRRAPGLLAPGRHSWLRDELRARSGCEADRRRPLEPVRRSGPHGQDCGGGARNGAHREGPAAERGAGGRSSRRVDRRSPRRRLRSGRTEPRHVAG
jgi:hypothetical protein